MLCVCAQVLLHFSRSPQKLFSFINVLDVTKLWLARWVVYWMERIHENWPALLSLFRVEIVGEFEVQFLGRIEGLEVLLSKVNKLYICLISGPYVGAVFLSCSVKYVSSN
jgi:hypothetical protein